MGLKRQLLASLVVQGAGAASVLLATLWLGARLGPEVQGHFSRTKTEIEFVAALALFGLPQALFFHVKSGGLCVRQALRWAGGSVALALPIGAAYLLLQQEHAQWPAAWVMGCAVAACVAHGQLRALVLVREPTLWFNAITALPQVLVFVAVAGVVLRVVPATPAWAGVFALAYGVAAVLAWLRLWPAAGLPQGSKVGGLALGHYGLASWLTAALSAGALLWVQRWVEAADGAIALGQFTVAMTLVLVPLVPIAYASPLLFRHWMEQPDPRAPQRWATRCLALLLVLAGLVWALSAWWPDLGLGSAYAGTTQALALLLAGGAAEAATRLLTVQAGANGLPWAAVRAEALRWAVLAAGSYWPLAPGLLPKCMVWALACWAAAAALAWQTHARQVPTGP